MKKYAFAVPALMVSGLLLTQVGSSQASPEVVQASHQSIRAIEGMEPPLEPVADPELKRAEHIQNLSEQRLERFYAWVTYVEEIERQEAERRAAAERERQRRAEQARAEQQSQQAAPAPRPASGTSGSVWDRLAQCESHGQWDYGPHSGWGSGRFHGGLQFHPGTWNAYKLPGYPAYAYQASRAQQIAVAERVKAAQGWGAWPACSAKLGLR